jgi:type IV secretion system protein VirB4
VCQLNLRGLDDALSVISASTDNIEIMHRVLEDRAAFYEVPQGDLTPEKWLDMFYENRKGSGKGGSRASNSRTGSAERLAS